MVTQPGSFSGKSTITNLPKTRSMFVLLPIALISLRTVFCRIRSIGKIRSETTTGNYDQYFFHGYFMFLLVDFATRTQVYVFLPLILCIEIIYCVYIPST